MLSENDITIIEAGKVDKHYWYDIWQFRELLFFMAWRDILVRYKQTVIGIAWSVIRPLSTVLIFSLIFGKLAAMPSDNIPYPILVFAAMLPWQFFSNALTDSSNSLIGNAGMISKIYFPRLIIPISSVIVCLVDFGISLVILAMLYIYYGFAPNWHIILLPIFLLLATFCALGIGMFFAALNVKYRDFRYIVPFVVQLGLYISPVGFSSSIIPAKWRLLYSINPMVGVIDCFRWALLGDTTQIYWPGLWISIGIICLSLFIGVKYLRKAERFFADVI